MNLYVLVCSATLMDNHDLSVALPLIANEAACGAQLDFSNSFFGISINPHQVLREPPPVAW